MADAPAPVLGTPAPVDGTPAPAATPPAGTPPPPPSVVIPDNWKEAISEEFRKDPSLEAIKSVEDLTKSYVHAQKMIGKDKVIVPDPKFATDKDWAAFFQKAGLPADLKDYKLEAPKDSGLDETFIGSLRETAHQLNILPSQAQKLLNWYSDKDKAMAAEAQGKLVGEITAAHDAYKKSQGAAYEKRVLYANKTIDTFGGAEMQKMFAENPALGNSPVFIEALAKIGEKLFAEDTFDGKERLSGRMSPQEASARANEIMGDKNHPYWKSEHPGHKDAVQFMSKLFEFQNPG